MPGVLGSEGGHPVENKAQAHGFTGFTQAGNRVKHPLHCAQA